MAEREGTSLDRMTALDDVINSIRRMEAEQGEIWATISEEDNSIGDDGVADLLIEIENRVMMVKDRLTKKRDANVNTGT